MHMGVLLTCISVYHMHGGYPQRTEDSTASPGTRITDMSCHIDAGK